MPCGQPQSLICSPSHMMNAVPVVSVSMVIRMNPRRRPIDQGRTAFSALTLKRDGNRKQS